ncbi:Coatomer subunit epsilon [Globomyces sp. JEL0801]|nr:Coatomer subunit epsilon [Globomyces sp. JEL0801]
MTDSLLHLKNQLYTGAYQTVINEAGNPQLLNSLSDLDKLHARVLLNRTYLTHGRFNLVISDIKKSDPDVLIAVQLLAMYLASPQTQSQVLQQTQNIIEQISDPEPVLCVVLATILTLAGLYDDALRLVVKHPQDLECVGLAVQLYCLIQRPDIAEHEVSRMKKWADDATLAQIIETWVGIFKGGPEKYQESFYVFDELTASHLATSKLLSSKAVCLIHSNRFEDANNLLLESLNKNPNDADTLANLVVVNHFLQKPGSSIAQYLS